MFGSDPQPTRSGGLQFYPNSNGYGYVQRDIIGPGGKKLPKFIVPHVELFTGIVGGLSTYRWRFDEALKHSRENALAMRRDTFIDACLRERKLAAAQLSWDITPENPVDPVQLEVANAVKSRISLIPDLEGLFMQSLESVWYGRAASHILWDEDDERGMRITDHYPINGDKLVFTYEGIPGILVHATAPLPDDAEIIFSERNRALLLSNPFWRERFLISIHEKIDADFYEPEFAGQRWGIGLRNYVYWYWWLLQEVMGWVIDFVEKVGLGVTVFYYEQGNKEAKSAAEDASKKQSRNTVLVLPRPVGQEKAGSGVERLEIPVVGAEFLLKVVETYFKDAIRQCINGQTLSAHAESTGLGSGVASLHGSTKDKIALSDSKRLGEALTRDIVFVDQRWNHKGTEKKFRLKWVFQQGRSDADRAMAAARAIFDMGGKLKESELLSIANLTAPAEGERTLERLDPTVNKDIFQMQMQMQQQAAAAQQQGAAGGSQYTDYSGPRGGQGRKNLQTGRIEYGKHLQAETLGQLHQNLKQEYAQGQPAQFGRMGLPVVFERGVQLKDIEEQRERAHEAGLVQLPPGGKGAMCGNCLFMQRHGDNAEGYCQHPKVKQRVHTDWCCNHYDSKGTIHFEKAHGEVQSLLDEIRGIVRPEQYANVPQGTGSTYLERPPTARGAEIPSTQPAPEVAPTPFRDRPTEKGPFAGYNQMFDERAKKLHGAIADPAARESLHGMIGSHNWVGDMGTALKSAGTHPSDVEDQIQNHAFRWLGAESPLFSPGKFTGGNFKHYWNSFLRTMGKHGREGAGMGKKIGALESDVLSTPLERGVTGIQGIADTKSIKPEEDLELQEGLKRAEDIWRNQDESGERDRVLQVVQKLLGKGGSYKVSDVIPRVIKTHPHMNAASIREHIGSLMEEGKLDTGPLDRPFSELSGQKVPDEEKVLRAAQRLIESGKESFTPYQIRRSVANRSPHLTTAVISGILDKLRGEGKLPEKFDKLPGGKGDDRPDSDFDPEQLAAGIKVEMEHTNDPALAKEIAKDHLTEDRDYYKKLKKMEEGNG